MKFQNGDVVTINWSGVGKNNGNFRDYPPVAPLTVVGSIGPVLGGTAYLVKDTTGLMDVVHEGVLIKVEDLNDEIHNSVGEVRGQ